MRHALRGAALQRQVAPPGAHPGRPRAQGARPAGDARSETHAPYVLAEGLDLSRDALTTHTSHFLTDMASDVLKTLKDRDARDAVNVLICDLAEDAVQRFAPGGGASQ